MDQIEHDDFSLEQGMPAEPDPHRTRKGHRTAAVIGILLAAAVVAGVGAVMWSENSAAAVAQAQAAASASQVAAANASASASAKASALAAAEALQEEQALASASAQAEADQQASVKSQMEAQGWHQASGYNYYRWEDHSNFRCGTLQCSYVLVVSEAPEGCTGGFYVEASIERGRMSVGMANGVTAALPRGKIAAVKLEDTSGTGDGNGFQLTQITCHGG
ncbi:hypothetical protein GCM10012320_36200 [Sinomonas cellulolyticus]|uniref:Uncharacterized protein n=1 Tax=Sinomonas cellulolyticus TaxID=2801916 RepID=A0ABS1K638_9MICC|nr:MULTISPECIES: hypothetical protein [Sinomonas]MBL0707151.1 hypothetical protein [Sinomonas cellulolyticus]GHG61351.1 hypothetical protein GCM10012320_36200 [Sinomonas sp. KCTC 49339]